MTDINWKVGEPVVVVRSSGRRYDKPTVAETTITKVGRKWAEVESEHWTRFSMETGREDSDFSAARRLFASEAHYLAEVARRKLADEASQMARKAYSHWLGKYSVESIEALIAALEGVGISRPEPSDD